jgi:hypothetical protein
MSALVAAASSRTNAHAHELDLDLDADDDLYDDIEARVENLLCSDSPRQGCVELAQALEEVMALLTAAASDFSDPRRGLFPMGQGGGAT